MSLSISDRVEHVDLVGHKRPCQGVEARGPIEIAEPESKKRAYGGDLAPTGANREERRSHKPNGLGEGSAR